MYVWMRVHTSVHVLVEARDVIRCLLLLSIFILRWVFLNLETTDLSILVDQ